VGTFYGGMLSLHCHPTKRAARSLIHRGRLFKVTGTRPAKMSWNWDTSCTLSIPSCCSTPVDCWQRLRKSVVRALPFTIGHGYKHERPTPCSNTTWINPSRFNQDGTAVNDSRAARIARRVLISVTCAPAPWAVRVRGPPP
jgi:hypothetical protein